MNNTWPLLNFSVLTLGESSGPKKKKKLFKCSKSWKAVNKWINKQNAIYPYKGILFSHKKKWNTDGCSILDKSQKHHAKWKRSDTYCMTSFIWNVQTGKPLERESINRLVVARGWLEELIGEQLLNGYRVSCKMITMFWNWREVRVPQHHECTQCYGFVYTL